MKIFNIEFHSDAQTFTGIFEIEDQSFLSCLERGGYFRVWPIKKSEITTDKVVRLDYRKTVFSKKTTLDVTFETFVALTNEARTELTLAQTHKEILVQTIDGALTSLPLETLEKIYALI
mgnify:CR=1 FL=1